MQRQNLASRQPNRPLQRDRLAWAPRYLTKHRPRPGLCRTRCSPTQHPAVGPTLEARKCCLNPVSNQPNGAGGHRTLGFIHRLQGHWLIKSVFAPPTHSNGLIRNSSAAPGSPASSLTRLLSYASSPPSLPRSSKIGRPGKFTSAWTPPTRPRPDAH